MARLLREIGALFAFISFPEQDGIELQLVRQVFHVLAVLGTIMACDGFVAVLNAAGSQLVAQR